MFKGLEMSNSPDTIKGSEVLASALADAKIKTIFTDLILLFKDLDI